MSERVAVPTEADIHRFLDRKTEKPATNQTLKVEGFGEIQLPASERPPAFAQPQNFAESALRPLTQPLDRMAARDQFGGLERLGAEADIPFDVATGVDFSARLMMSASRRREEVESMLLAIPGVESVRFNSIGDPVIRILDQQTGQPRDILANPVGWDMGDIAPLMANAPEILAGFLLSRGVKVRPGMIPALKEIGLMATGSTTAGALKDIAVQEKTTGRVDPGAVAEAAGVQFAIEALLGISVSAGAKVFTKTVSPFSMLTPKTPPEVLRFDAQAAKAYFRERSAAAGHPVVDLIQTPAEATGSQLLARTEAFALQNPGSTRPIQRLLWEREAQLDSLVNIMHGLPPGQGINSLPTSAAVGGQTVEQLQGRLSPFVFDVERKQFQLKEAAIRDISSSIRNATKIPSPVLQTASGARMVERANGLYGEFRDAASARYDKVYSNPLVQGRTIDTGPLAADAEDLLKNAFPAAEVEREAASGLLDAAGRPQTTTETEMLTGFVEGGILDQLRQLATLKEGKIGLRDLIQLRRDVDDSILRGRALAEVPERRLSQLRQALTKRIKTGLDELGDPELRKAYDQAEGFYAANIGRFKEPGVIELFRDEQARGSLGAYEVAQRALRDTDTWNQYRNLFGADSTEHRLMKRMAADRIIGPMPGGTVVDWKGFSGRLESFYKSSPEIAEEVFGAHGKRLLAAGRVLKKGDRIAVDDLADLLERGDVETSLRNFIGAQGKRDAVTANQLARQVLEGKVKPADAVGKLALKADPQELDEVLLHLADEPVLLEDLRKAALTRFFTEAMDPFNASTSARFNRGQFSSLTTEGVMKTLGDEAQQARWMRLLGPRGVQDIRQMVAAMGVGEVREQTFQAAGRLSAGSKVAGLHQGRFLNFADSVLHGWVLGSLYGSRSTRAWIANNALDPQTAAIFNNYLIGSVPFGEALLDTYAEGGTTADAGAVGAVLKEANDRISGFLGPTPTQHAQ